MEQIPSSDVMILIESLVSLLKVQDVRYDLSYYGVFFDQIPRYIGTSKVLDASINALVSIFPSLYTEDVSRQALIQYGNALKTLRSTLQDPTESKSVGTMCAIYLIMVCEGWISMPDDPHVSHGEAMMHILNTMVHQKDMGQFERQLMYTLALPVVIHSAFNPRIRLSPWLEILIDHCPPPNRTITDHGEPFQTMTLQSLSKLPAFVHHPEEHYYEILSTYEKMRIDFVRIEQYLSKIWIDGAAAHNPSVLRTLNRFQAAYCMLLSFAFVLNRVLRAFNPSNIALLQQSSVIFDKVIRTSWQASTYKPVGAGFVPVCLFLLWLCTHDTSQLGTIEGLLAYYRPQFPVAIVSAWASPIQKKFEEILERVPLMLL
ncbi:hypothetical protein BDV59DRAFT_178687 [Aspergillus ambiguus]|uniref:uncharacterized protein n=1 Tax=Aspergillus ambiguus TaxID=176160 RepID=UPI003CCD3554